MPRRQRLQNADRALRHLQLAGSRDRDQRLDQNLEAAREASRLEDWTSARDKARSVLLVRRDDFEAFRIWCRALAELGEPQAYMVATQRFAHPKATDEDRLESLRLLALQAPQALALGAYASLPEASRNRAEFRAAITPLLILRGQAELAENGLREALGEDPAPVVVLELIRYPTDLDWAEGVIVEVLGDEEQRTRLGENGRVRVLERFTWRAHAIGLVELWRAELEERQGRVAHAHR